MKTIRLAGHDIDFTPAIQIALRAVDIGVLNRSNGGFGQDVRRFVPLKTARRLEDLDLASIAGKGKKASLQLTSLGCSALTALQKVQ